MMRRPLSLALFAIGAVLPALACSGAFTGAAVDGGPGEPTSGGSTESEPPVGSGSEAGPITTSTEDSGSSVSPPADASTDAKPIVDAATDGPCVEPEPNGSAAIPARLPVPFNCGRIDSGGDVDHFTYTTVAGDTAVRFTASPMDRAVALNVTVRRGGTTLVLGAGDTVSGLQAGTVVTFEVKATDDLALSYGIVIVR
ncbi:MAG: hypothetical protein IPK71_07490 [Myxococcales bacterium]|nr:hypothetical protein [Myxococcales bacterium]